MKLADIPLSSRRLALTLGIVVLLIGMTIFLVPYSSTVTFIHPVTKDRVLADDNVIAAALTSEPVELRIPKLSIKTNFVQLGLQDNGEIEVPEGYTEVGWYTKGPTPGANGPAIVLGHVDSKNGPGVFYSLGQLAPGDTIDIDRADGTTATFKVLTSEHYDRDAFPSMKVYGNIGYPGLRLITCSGTYSHTVHEYDKVLVVYAELVDMASTTPH